MEKDNRVSFECPHLEVAIRQEFSSRLGEYSNDQEITLADMARLNSDLGGEDGHLTLPGYEISSLKDLAGLTNLKSLFVNSSRIKDFSLLDGLPNFTDLDLGPSLLLPKSKQDLNKSLCAAPLVLYRPPTRVEGSEMEIEDLIPLCGLKNLRALNISSLHKVKDLSPLSGMRKLKSLRLSGYSLADYSPLYGLKNLEDLFLPFCQLSDPVHLTKLTNLKKLTLPRSIFTNQQIKQISKSLPSCSLQLSNG
jgi:hypothetical protein